MLFFSGRGEVARVSVLSVAGFKFPAVFLGEGRLGCGWSGRWPEWILRKPC